jgi:prepilin-type N-terminal cleavage/methylation domain-containing protein
VRKTGNKGFSFVELIVAITIMAIGILPIMWFFSRSNLGTIKTRDEVYAQQYAAELYDYVIASGFNAYEPTGEEGIDVPSITVEGETIAIEERFQRKLIVENLAPAHSTVWPLSYRTVCVEVSWTADQQQRSLRLTGIIHAPK